SGPSFSALYAATTCTDWGIPLAGVTVAVLTKWKNPMFMLDVTGPEAYRTSCSVLEVCVRMLHYCSTLVIGCVDRCRASRLIQMEMVVVAVHVHLQSQFVTG